MNSSKIIKLGYRDYLDACLISHQISMYTSNIIEKYNLIQVL